jgi:hypothetical protein
MKCEIIQDLLPSYMDGLTSEVSNQEIEVHLKDCTECRSYYEAMKSNVDTSKVELEDNEFIKVLNKIRKVTLEKTVLVSATIICILITLLYCGYRYMFGLSSVLPEEVSVACNSDGNKRELIVEPKNEKWHIILGYSTEVVKGEFEEIFILSPLKSRAWEGYQRGVTNVFDIEFLDENTIAIPLPMSGSTEYIDFDQNDYFLIDFSGKMSKVYISDLYNNNFQGF